MKNGITQPLFGVHHSFYFYGVSLWQSEYFLFGLYNDLWRTGDEKVGAPSFLNKSSTSLLTRGVERLIGLGGGGGGDPNQELVSDAQQHLL